MEIFKSTSTPRSRSLYWKRILIYTAMALYFIFHTIEKKYSFENYVAITSLMLLLLLILRLGMFSVKTHVEKISLDTELDEITVTYRKFFSFRSINETCGIHSVKYYFENRDKDVELGYMLSFELPNGSYFIIDEGKGFSKIVLDRMVEIFETYSCRKFDAF